MRNMGFLPLGIGLWVFLFSQRKYWAWYSSMIDWPTLIGGMVLIVLSIIIITKDTADWTDHNPE